MRNPDNFLTDDIMTVSVWICVALWLGLNVTLASWRVYVTRPLGAASRSDLEARTRYAARAAIIASWLD
jgi:hypothetical protein